MAAGENPAAEMIKSVSLIIAGLLLLLPGFLPTSSVFCFYAAGAKHLTVKLMPHLRFSRMPGGGFSAGTGGGNTLMVSTSERMMTATALIIKTIARINVETPDYVVMPFSGVFRFGRNSHNPASMISA